MVRNGKETDFSHLHRAIFNRTVFWSAVCRSSFLVGGVSEAISNQIMVYNNWDVIFLGGTCTGFQKWTPHLVFLAPTGGTSRLATSSLGFVVRENHSLSHFRGRLVASLGLL